MIHESLVDLLERGIAKVDGVRALERRLGWSAGGISQSRADGRHVSPFRAGQLADLVGEDPLEAVLKASQVQSRTDEEVAFWEDLRRRALPASAPSHPVDLRELVETLLGPRYVMVIGPALQRAGITSTRDATEAAKKAAVFFDDHEQVFASGKSQIPIGGRRELMADYLTGQPGIYERVQQLCVSSAGAT